MKFSPFFRSALTIGACFLAIDARAAVVYSQPLNLSDAYLAESQQDFIEADNFQLSSNAAITSIKWAGVDLNEIIPIPGLGIVPASFSITILGAGGDNQPGDVLYTAMVDNFANAKQTNQQIQGLTLYDYSATLSTPFQAQAGQTYWLEIADSTDNGGWFWAEGSGGDGAHLTKPGSLRFHPGAGDANFSLSTEAAPVPEPNSLLLMSVGLVAIGLSTFALRARG